MRRTRRWVLTAVLIVGALVSPRSARAQAAAPDTSWGGVDRVLGRPGTSLPGEVRKYGFPRSDLRVVVDGVVLKPALALGSWLAFRRSGASASDAMVMGDLVLTEAEVPQVVARLQAAGLRPTALHNHLQRETPHVMYLHVDGRGDPVALSTALRAALAATATPLAAPGSPPPTAFPLDTAALAQALGRRGAVNGGVYQVSVPRADPVREAGVEIPPAMGVATAINLQPTDHGRAIVTGDFVLVAAEVDPVIRTLAAHGIVVTALHSHMLDEEPRLLFLHFWAQDDALRLARGLRAAIAETRSRAPTP